MIRFLVYRIGFSAALRTRGEDIGGLPLRSREWTELVRAFWRVGYSARFAAHIIGSALAGDPRSIKEVCAIGKRDALTIFNIQPDSDGIFEYGDSARINRAVAPVD